MRPLAEGFVTVAADHHPVAPSLCAVRHVAEGILHLKVTEYDMTETEVQVALLRPGVDKPILLAAERDAFTEDEEAVRARIAAVVGLAEKALTARGLSPAPA